MPMSSLEDPLPLWDSPSSSWRDATSYLNVTWSHQSDECPGLVSLEPMRVQDGYPPQVLKCPHNYHTQKSDPTHRGRKDRCKTVPPNMSWPYPSESSCAEHLACDPRKQLQGFRVSLPQMCHVCKVLILSWKQLRPWEFKRNYCPSLNYLGEVKSGIFPREEFLLRINVT